VRKLRRVDGRNERRLADDSLIVFVLDTCSWILSTVNSLISAGAVSDLVAASSSTRLYNINAAQVKHI
jgi:hypothetical protein